MNAKNTKGNQVAPVKSAGALFSAANIPEIVPFRESSSAPDTELQGDQTPAGDGANHRFRESSPAKVPTAKENTPPRKPRNRDRRAREYLTADEVDRLSRAAERIGRHGHRDATMILLAYRHGLRVSELVALRWEQVDLEAGFLHVRRLKRGTDSTHPLHGPEIRALRRVAREYPPGPYCFSTERRGPLTPSTVGKMIARAGDAADIGFPIHPHMLRHACGFKLANDGQDTRAVQHYLGHRNIQHTVRYTELTADRFKGFWKD